jgi:hypothetical protein
MAPIPIEIEFLFSVHSEAIKLIAVLSFSSFYTRYNLLGKNYAVNALTSLVGEEGFHLLQFMDILNSISCINDKYVATLFKHNDE